MVWETKKYVSLRMCADIHLIREKKDMTVVMSL